MTTARSDLACALLLSSMVGLGAVACGQQADGSPGASTPVAYDPSIDPADFSAVVDNPYFPMTPGSRWVYASSDGSERIEVEVTKDTRTVMGVDCVVVSDTAYVDGQVVERTLDWYSQDGTGAVWYFGEETAEFENGSQTSTSGSWEAGLDGAQPGVVMQADPRPDEPYRQEYYPGEAEDMGQVLSIGEEIAVPAGAYRDVVVTRDWTPLEPDVEENKYYAPGVGVVAEVKVKGGSGRVELVEFVSS